MQTPRSWLFVPGDKPRLMAKALGSGADALILDLEDAVGPASKGDARTAVAAFLAGPRALPCFVRVNALDSGLLEEDLAALTTRPDGIVLPKCEGPADLKRLAELTGDLPILAIATETVQAVRALMIEDWRHPHLIGMAWGGEDLSADLGASANRGADGQYLSPFRFARDAMLFAAKAAGVAAVDAVFTDYRDHEALRAEADAAAAIGFASKMAIHPGQIATIHLAFEPSPKQVEWAKKVVAAMAEARGGVRRLDGQMLDAPHLAQARQILARHAYAKSTTS